MTQTDLEKTMTVGIFESEAAAQQAVMQLRREGYSTNDVDIVAEDNPEENEPGEVKAETVTKSYTGLATGAVIGGIIGALVGFLFGSGVLPVPQIGLVQALGTIGMVLVGAFVGVALGILGGSMGGLSWARQPTKGLEKTVQAGKWLVTIQSPDLAAAQTALREAGAIGLKTQTPKPAQVKRQ